MSRRISRRLLPSLLIGAVFATTLVTSSAADEVGVSGEATVTTDLSAPALSTREISVARQAQLALDQIAQDGSIDPSQWSITNIIETKDGRSIVHLGQQIDGYSVIGNAIVLTLSAQQSLVGSTVIAAPVTVDLTNSVSQTQAQSAAKLAVAQFLSEPISNIDVGTSQLAILLPNFAPQLTSARLALRIVGASAVSAKQVEVWVDAATAEVLAVTSLTKFSSQSPSVCNANNTNWSAYRICKVTDTQAGSTDRLRQTAIITDVSNFFDRLISTTGFTTYDFNSMVGNRQSTTSGNPLSVVINSCMSGDSCPMENAFWNSWDRANPNSLGYDPNYSSNDGSDRFFGSMYIGAGLDRSNDVIAHEISHGVSDAVVSTNDSFGQGFTYSGQSGALSESFSDIFGESIDQLNDNQMAATTYLGKLAYKKNVYALSSAQKSTLRTWANSISGSSRTTINVYHYTTTGKFNTTEKTLANRRMAAVKSYLISRGVTTSFTLKMTAIKSAIYKSDYLKVSKSGTYSLLPVENLSDEQKWLIAEDIPSSVFGGPLRSLADPANTTWLPNGYEQPDSVSSPLYESTQSCVPSSSNDNCYVHTNSGVPNKAAYLISEGGTFNGSQVAGIGIWKMNYLMFDVLMHGTSGMTFAQFGAQTLSSCLTLAAAGTGGFTTADCSNSVLPALQATGLY